MSGREYQAYIYSASDIDDYYHIVLPERHNIEIWLNNIPDGTDYQLLLYDTSRERIGYSAEVGNLPEHILKENMPPGPYYIRIYQYSGFSATQPYALRTVYQ